MQRLLPSSSSELSVALSSTRIFMRLVARFSLSELVEGLTSTERNTSKSRDADRISTVEIDNYWRRQRLPCHLRRVRSTAPATLVQTVSREHRTKDTNHTLVFSAAARKLRFRNTQCCPCHKKTYRSSRYAGRKKSVLLRLNLFLVQMSWQTLRYDFKESDVKSIVFKTI